MKYGFFDSINTGTAENPVYDRTVDAEFFTQFFGAVQSNGVSGFGVTAGSGLTVTVASGKGVINGHFGYEESETTLSLSSGSSQRIYSICLRLAAPERTISLVAVNGDISRTEDIYDLCIAKVTIPANSSQITAAMISDTRTDAALCGMLTAANASTPHTTYVQSSQPSSPVSGDLWFW